MEDNLNLLTPASPELGTAQPQLVQLYFDPTRKTVWVIFKEWISTIIILHIYCGSGWGWSGGLGGHNGGKYLNYSFHVSGHLAQFGKVIFFVR